MGGKRRNISNVKRKALTEAGVGRGAVGKTGYSLLSRQQPISQLDRDDVQDLLAFEAVGERTLQDERLDVIGRRVPTPPDVREAELLNLIRLHPADAGAKLRNKAIRYCARVEMRGNLPPQVGKPDRTATSRRSRPYPLEYLSS